MKNNLNLYISYHNYKGGINNLIVVSDKNGNRATSQKDIGQAKKNYKAMIRRAKVGK